MSTVFNILAILVMVLLSFALTALGFCLAWRMTSTQGFHAIMNLFLMPLWFLSGALFPGPRAPRHGVARCGRPVTGALRGGRPGVRPGEPPVNAA